MSTKHSPPPTSASRRPHQGNTMTAPRTEVDLENVPPQLLGDQTPLQHYDSAPDLRAIVSNATERKKRKLEDVSTKGENQLKEMLMAMSDEQNKNFFALQSTVNSLKEQNDTLTKSMEMISKKYDDFLEKINELESERKEDKKTIGLLEEKIDMLERKNRNTGLEFRNIPKKQGEKKEDVLRSVTNILKTLDIDVSSNDIKDTYRLNSKNSKDSDAPVIIADFTTVFLRDNVLKKVKEFNKDKGKEDKLNTQHLNPQSLKKPIFVSETLTHKAQRLFYQARLFQKAHDYDYCWTSYGTIYLRKKENMPQIRINSDADIENLKRAI